MTVAMHAPLSVERQRAEHTLAHRHVEIRRRKNEARIFGVEAEADAQPVRRRVRFLERVGGCVGANEAETVQ